jgi:hypothetical protein
MKGHVRIRLLTHVMTEDPEHQVVANIYPVDQRPRTGGTPRDVFIPVGSTGYAPFDLEEGRYIIEAVLPSGDITSEEVQVKPGSSVDVDLKAGYSQYEVLGWQHVLGNVAETSIYGPALEAAFADEGTIERMQPAWWAETTPESFLDANGTVWAGLARATHSTLEEVFELLHVTKRREAAPLLEDSLTRLYRLGGDGPLTNFSPSPSSALSPDVRRYLLVPSTDGLDVVTVPLPWVDARRGREVPFEVLVRMTSADPRVSVSVRDPTLSSALGYMTLGALPTAARMFDVARDMLYGKMINPLAATGGAYVLLATEQGSEAKQWHDWIKNLMDWFEWLPDGAILFGSLKLRHRRNEEDIAQARSALMTGYHRGIPYYSVGVRWLVDGLTLFAEKDVEARSMLESVRQVARRVSVAEPFTIVSLTA